MVNEISSIKASDEQLYRLKDTVARETLLLKADISSISSYASKVIIDNRISGISGKNDLSVVKLNADEYANLLIGGQLLSNALYVVEDDYIDAYGQQLKNLASPTDLSDAATKEYVDSAVSNSLNDYYKKSETSNAVEISTALDQKSKVMFVEWED